MESGVAGLTAPRAPARAGGIPATQRSIESATRSSISGPLRASSVRVDGLHVRLAALARPHPHSGVLGSAERRQLLRVLLSAGGTADAVDLRHECTHRKLQICGASLPKRFGRVPTITTPSASLRGVLEVSWRGAYASRSGERSAQSRGSLASGSSR